MKKHAGYTLVEMVISIAVGLVIIAVIYAVVNMGQRSTVNIERKVAAHQDARAALGLMVLEIQMASFNPTYATGVWVAPGDCTTASVNQGYRGIQAATDSSITVEADINDSSVICDATNEVITYAYDSANQYLTRLTRSTSGTSGNIAFLGAMPGDPRAVRVINTAAVPVFQYFDAQGTQIAAAGLPAGIPNIARIDITLWVETEDVDPNSGQRRRMVYSTSVIPRNHVIKQ